MKLQVRQVNQFLPYLIKAPLALDKLTYLPDEGKVLYGPKHDQKTFHPMDNFTRTCNR